jgi:Na+/H+ antiporter NhaA
MIRGGIGQSETPAVRRSLLVQLAAPVRQFLSTEAGSAGLLLAATAVALVWANSPWSESYVSLSSATASISVADWNLSMDLAHWVNDGLMAVFFFVVGLEVRREFSVGALTTPRRASIPVIAAIGGLVVPALAYLLLAPSDANGAWGVVIGTDTAFMLGALAVVGPRLATQLRVFLLTLTVIDDIVAVSVIGVFYSDSLDVSGLVLMAVFAAAMALMSRYGVWPAMPYLLAGLGLWLATLHAGLHASIAGMLGGLLVAAHLPRRDAVERAVRRFRAFRQSPGVEAGRTAHRELVRAVSVNERLQIRLHPWASYGVVPLFALANAGVDLRDGVLTDALTSRLTWAVAIALVVGKLVGITLASWAGVRAGLGKLPQGVGFGHVTGGAALSGIGFTVSLLIAGLAFPDPVNHGRAVVGILIAAVLATAAGWVAFRAAAVLRGQTDADLPRRLDPPVDPDRDPIRGPADAPITLVEYGDYECPFCAAVTGVADELRAWFGDGIRYVFRHLPLADVHPHAELAARAAVAAHAQGRFWDMHETLFAHADELDYEDLAGYAGELGLDVERFLRDLEADHTAARVREDIASAEASGARGTPTFFINGVRHTGPHDAETMTRALGAARDSAGAEARPVESR